ncbi:putative membrane protein [Staphylococcus auricularis]|nr:Uncharacterised protein [Staphylococcus auricularis]
MALASFFLIPVLVLVIVFLIGWLLIKLFIR